MSNDDLAAELAAIRERFDGAAWGKDLAKWAATIKDTGGGSEYDWMAQSLVDVPRLLAVVETILGPHQPGPVKIWGHLCPAHEACRMFSIDRAEMASIQACSACRANVFVSCAGCGPEVSHESCRARERAVSALTGTGATP